MSLIALRKNAAPTAHELEARFARYPRGRVRPQQVQPSLYQQELAKRIKVAGNTIVDIEKRRVLVTEATEQLYRAGCVGTEIKMPVFADRGLQDLRHNAGLSRKTVCDGLLRLFPTPDRRAIHPDTLMDIEHARIEITDTMVDQIAQVIKTLSSKED